MWTTVLVITLYSSFWCIHGHIQWFMQHNFLFPKVASPSQCASLWRDVRHARVLWLCWQFFRTFQTWKTLWRSVSRVTKFIQNISNMFIFHLTQSFRPAIQRPSTIWRNPRQQNHSPENCSESGPRPRHSSPECGWRHENDFIVMGNVH